MLENTIGIVYMAAGLFASLSGFKILKPYKNNDLNRRNIDNYQFFYRYGGLLVFAYGVFKLLK